MAQRHGLIDPFNVNSPQIVDALLNGNGIAGRIGHISYSPSGTFVAGCTLYKSVLHVSVWDLLTGSLALLFEPMEITSKIVSFVWGLHITVATIEGKIYNFNVETGGLGRQHNVTVGEGDAIVFVHPRPQSDNYFVVYRSGLVELLDADTTTPIRQASGENVTCSALHSGSGLLYLGLTKDIVTVFNTLTQQNIQLEGNLLFGANSIVQSLDVNPSGKQIAFIFKDKTIRIADLFNEGNFIKIQPRHKLQDVVNRWAWNVCGFSHDGELIWGSFCSPGTHLVYLWDSNSGTLVKMLEGPKEDLVLARWNTKGPSLITGTTFGGLYRWVPDYPVKWSALVPGLEELDENVEYIEREDEFDVTVEEEVEKRRKTDRQDDVFIDVITKEPTSLHVENVKLDVKSIDNK